MLRRFRRRREEEKPLWFKLAKELKRNGGPMPRARLVSWYELKYDTEEVERVLDLLVEAGLLLQRRLSFGERVRECAEANPDVMQMMLALPEHAGQLAA
jgi:hypothetical protein